jgi:subtilase family serine protease
MSSRNRLPLSIQSHNRRLSRRPLLENLEQRLVLSTPGGVSSLLPYPTWVPKEVMGPDGGIIPDVSSGPTGYTPKQLEDAYGLNAISFNGIKGNGAGQTIALVDDGDNPSFPVSTSSSFNTGSLHLFDQYFGLPDPPSFTKVNQTGAASPLPGAVSGWTVEIALDIEWAHVMAPGANIVLVEASTNFETAEATAGKIATVVSMSFGGGESGNEKSNDATFNVPGVAYLASTGDSGAPGGYPAYSPNVVAVGGTTLQNLDGNGDYPGTGNNGEIGWTDGGGGISTVEAEPAFQQSVQSSGKREIPDIAADADPNTGVPVYDTYDFGSSTPWEQIGGTSLSSPLMAGMTAIVDQGRIIDGGATLSSNQLQTELYAIHTTTPTDFHDILHGNNGYPAGPGYDLVTGLGSPNGASLVPDLANYGLTPNTPPTSIAVTPVNPSVLQGGTLQFTAMGTYTGGKVVNITNSVTWASSIPAVATINATGLATGVNVGTTVITASLKGVTSPGDTLTVNSPYVVNTTVDASTYVAGQTTLREAVAAANANPGHVISFDPTVFATAQTITLTLGQIELSDTAGSETITGPAAGVTVSAGGKSRVFQVDSGVIANFSGLTIANGKVTGAQLGGGLYSYGGTVSLTNCTVSGNSAYAGGGLYLIDGSATLTNTTIHGNTAQDDQGGGLFNLIGTATLTNCTVSGNTGGGVENNFGTGTLTGCTITGNSGGGLFNFYAGVTLNNCTVSSNTAQSGAGLFTVGGNVTLTGTTVSGNTASTTGGGLFSQSANLTLTNSVVSGNTAASSGGGIEVLSGSDSLTNTTVSGNTAASSGGGLFTQGASNTMVGSTVSGNSTGIGNGGGMFSATSFTTLTNSTFSGDTAGTGGGLFVQGGNATLINCTVSSDVATPIKGKNSSASGGGLFSSGAYDTLMNTIVAGNLNATTASDVGGTDTLHGSNNLIGTGGSGGLVNGVNANLVGVANPGLAPLANNGGPTQTMALLPGSPAIGGGVSGSGIPTIDERGMTRSSAIDIGAYQTQTANPNIVVANAVAANPPVTSPGVAGIFLGSAPVSLGSTAQSAPIQVTGGSTNAGPAGLFNASAITRRIGILTDGVIVRRNVNSSLPEQLD